MMVEMTIEEAISVLKQWLMLDEYALEPSDTSDYAQFVRRQDAAVERGIQALLICKEKHLL
jgi:hypothetical protein